MSILVPIVMFGWIPLSLYLFSRDKDPVDAILIVVVGGILFLPLSEFKIIPHVPLYDKVAAISFSLLVGELSYRKRADYALKLTAYDLPMLVWCFASPVLTSLSNGLGLYDGLSNAMRNVLLWWLFYWYGRKYFRDAAAMRKLLVAIVVGGLLYFPLMVFEVRVGPQLSRMVYGFMAPSYLQHVRYGSFRPIVFMQHGLMVALWATEGTLAAFWLWMTGTEKKIKGIPILIVTLVLLIGAIICKSSGALVFLGIGLALFPLVKRSGSLAPFRLMLAVVLGYMALRLSNLLPIWKLQVFLEKYFNPERVQSALFRLRQEDLFGAKSMLHPLFGWGGYRRGWPVDPATGQQLDIIDALWTIIFNNYGFLGLVSLFVGLQLGPWLLAGAYSRQKVFEGGKAKPELVDGMILCLIVAFYQLDCLLNNMHNPVYILASGVLLSNYLALRGAEARLASPALAAGGA